MPTSTLAQQIGGPAPVNGGGTPAVPRHDPERTTPGQLPGVRPVDAKPTDAAAPDLKGPYANAGTPPAGAAQPGLWGKVSGWFKGLFGG
jgi:hypothetical protein